MGGGEGKSQAGQYCQKITEGNGFGYQYKFELIWIYCGAWRRVACQKSDCRKITKWIQEMAWQHDAGRNQFHRGQEACWREKAILPKPGFFQKEKAGASVRLDLSFCFQRFLIEFIFDAVHQA